MFERPSLRRFLGLVLLSCALVFATAAAPPPGAVPSPPPTPASLEQMPVVLIYPFDVQTGADPRIGVAIAQILAQEMSAVGGIAVLPVPQGVKRADFLDSARTAKADFYISGYVTPVGDSAAVVEQVVSVDSGVILFSQTAQVSSVADVASQSLLARSQILAFVGRGTENVQEQPSNTPAPTSSNGAQVPIQGLGNIVNSVFKHSRGGRTPSPAPVVKPARGVIVAPVTATAPTAQANLSAAERELYFALNKLFNVQLTPVTTSVAQSTDQICGANRDNTIATGSLQSTPGRHGTFAFTLVIYTCFGAVLEREVGKGATIKIAVDAAVTAYAKAHPDNS
jgi:hypothetical protein